MRIPNAVLEPFADWVIARAKRTPYWHLQDYMERFWVLRFGRSTLVDASGEESPRFAARVHHILRSDRGRDFHDHPWQYVTIVLRGGYVETRPVFDRQGRVIGEREKFYGPGSILFRRATSWHRLTVPSRLDTWTLFCTGPRSQDWGFLTEFGKVASGYYRAGQRASVTLLAAADAFEQLGLSGNAALARELHVDLGCEP